MLHSLRIRMLLILVLVPVVALASVAIAARISNDSTLDSRLQFQIQPVIRAGGGPTNPGDTNDIPVFTTEVDIDPSSQPVTFEDPATGQAFTIQAERGFVQAYERDRQATIDTINRQMTIAAIAVAVVALVTAVWLSRRIVRPVEELTRAARRLESGDLSERVYIQSSDEIGALGHAFNEMAASIEHSQDLRKQMTSDVAHELRTPLNNISGYLDAIADGVVQADAAVIASLQEEAELLVRLVADLEQLSLADSGHQLLMVERLAMAEVVERAVALVSPRARANGVLIESDVNPSPPVDGDASRLGQVVRNLLENAITHTPSGGRVTVTLQSRTDVVLLEVRDTGAGIAPEHLPFIFERFYRADRSRTRATGGAGLGLAIVKQLVEAHGGSVSASNAADSGALFTVELPMAQQRPSAQPAPATVPVPRPS